MDSQANLTIGLGFNPDELEYTMAKLIDNKISDYSYQIEKDKYLLNAEGVDLIPSDIRLCAVETKILNVINRENMLKNILSTVKEDYDYILIDCLPSLGNLNINAFVAADSVIIPVQAHYYPLRGMEQLLQSIMSVQAQINHYLKVEGILLTMFDKRTKLSREVKNVINEVIIADDETIEKYDELIDELDDELYQDIYSNSSDYEIVEVNGEINTSLKEVLVILTVITEQEIQYDEGNIETVRSIHNKIYSITKKTSTYYCEGCTCYHTPEENCPGNCTCSGHSKIEINIIVNSFEEMLEIFNFDNEQKEWAKTLFNTDYSEIYSNLD
ncbi:AAA family ATPase [Sedimentibacter sp. zth1]|uniref:ParA family protein n=1 Tax=Sedimentibacter sp. zth1 TaxID=2816908 RepID=UPI001A92B21A|nr:AAA family ATPase [Sedimentibacter sp. zth1]